MQKYLTCLKQNYTVAGKCLQHKVISCSGADWKNSSGSCAFAGTSMKVGKVRVCHEKIFWLSGLRRLVL